MALERLTADLNIIQTLPDQPAMTGAELKAKFDEAGGIRLARRVRGIYSFTNKRTRRICSNIFKRVTVNT